MFDSKQYNWSAVEIVFLGKFVTGIRGVSYKVSHEKEAIYGRGNEPVTIGRGNKTYEGSVSVLQSELEALIEAAGAGKDITDIPSFDISIAYVPKDGGTVVTDILKNVEFTEMEKSISQGDKFMEVELPVVALGLKLNA